MCSVAAALSLAFVRTGTTERNVHQCPAPDLVNREFVAASTNQLWVANMTYIPTWTGFLYLSVLIDVYSPKVVGWAFGERMTSDLVILALNMALMTGKPQSVVHHCDQGSQYTSIAFGKRCKEMGVADILTCGISTRKYERAVQRCHNELDTSWRCSWTA
jgi:transposase InsO family protein